MRVLVCGGRDFDNQILMDAVLDKYHFHYGFGTIIEGGARGADSQSKSWAEYHEIPVEEYPADWTVHGKKAGVLRNIEMLEKGKPDLVIAFPGGRGTAHMVKIAKEANVKVIEID